jgi:hypothetical protein
MNGNGPLAVPPVEDTRSPFGRISLKEKPVPPPLLWITAMEVSVEKIPWTESFTGSTKQAESWPEDVPAFIRVGELGKNNNFFIRERNCFDAGVSTLFATRMNISFGLSCGRRYRLFRSVRPI